MKKSLMILLTVVVLSSLVGCGSTAPGSSEPISDNTNIETTEVTLHEEEFEYHGVHVKLPSSINTDALKEEGNSIDQITSVNNLDDPVTGLIWFSASLDTDGAVNDTGTADNTYNSYSAMIHYAQFKDGDNEYWPFEYERVQIGGTNVLIGTCYHEESESWHTRAYVILENNVISLEYTTPYEQYNDVIRQSIETIWVDEEEIPEIIRNTSPETLQEHGLNTQAIESYGLYINMPESYIPLSADDGRLVWSSPDGNTILYLVQDTSALLDVDEETLRTALEQDPNFQEITHFNKGIYHGMYATEAYYTYRGSDGSDEQGCMIAFLPDMFGGTATILHGSSYSYDLEATVDNLATTIRYADGWTTDFLEVDPIPMNEFQEQ